MHDIILNVDIPTTEQWIFNYNIIIWFFLIGQLKKIQMLFEVNLVYEKIISKTAFYDYKYCIKLCIPNMKTAGDIYTILTRSTMIFSRLSVPVLFTFLKNHEINLFLCLFEQVIEKN